MHFLPLKLIYYVHKPLLPSTNLDRNKQVQRTQTILSPEEDRKTETLLAEWIRHFTSYLNCNRLMARSTKLWL